MIESLSAEIIPDGGSGCWEVFLGETGESSEDIGFALRRTDFLEDGGRGASGSLPSLFPSGAIPVYGRKPCRSAASGIPDVWNNPFVHL